MNKPLSRTFFSLSCRLPLNLCIKIIFRFSIFLQDMNLVAIFVADKR